MNKSREDFDPFFFDPEAEKEQQQRQRDYQEYLESRSNDEEE